MEKAATQAKSSRKNLEDLLHVTVGYSGCLLGTATVLPLAQVGGVPVPPMVLGVCLVETVMGLRGLVEKIGKSCDVGSWCARHLPPAAGKPSRDFLQQPAVAVRILERSKGEVGTALRVASVSAWVKQGAPLLPRG